MASTEMAQRTGRAKRKKPWKPLPFTVLLPCSHGKVEVPDVQDHVRANHLE